MPFTVPNVFVNATVIDADKIVENNEALRKYLNTGIVQADIDDASVGTTDIVRGEYSQVSRDHQFTSGDIYTQYRKGDVKSRTYTTGQLKEIDDLGSTIQWLNIPGTGKRFFLEDDATVFFHVYSEVRTPEDQLTDNLILEYSYYTININGSYASDATAYSFEEKSSTLSGLINDGCSTNVCHSRPFSGIYLVALTAGWNEICLAADINSSHSYVGASSSYIEIFYKS